MRLRLKFSFLSFLNLQVSFIGCTKLLTTIVFNYNFSPFSASPSETQVTRMLAFFILSHLSLMLFSIMYMFYYLHTVFIGLFSFFTYFKSLFRVSPLNPAVFLSLRYFYLQDSFAVYTVLG